MSLDALKAFGKKVMEDADLKAKAKKVGMENVDGIIDLAKENGFDISKEDFEAAAKEAQSSDELNEDDLKKIAGGFVTTTAAAVVSAAAAAVAAGTAVTQTTHAGGW